MKFTAAALSLGLASVASAQLAAIPIIAAVAPGTASCPGTDLNQECRNTEQVARALVRSFIDYGIYHPNQMAAITSLMAFESLDFKFKRNQNPEHYGQGTANQQSAQYNLLYAKSIPELEPLVREFASADAMTPDQKTSMLTAIIADDQWNFGTGAWFITSQCPDVLDQLASNADAGFDAYMVCIGIPLEGGIDPKRTEYWNNAKAAFKVV
jgi:hypothetical protein